MTELSRRRFTVLMLATPWSSLARSETTQHPILDLLADAARPREPNEVWVLVDDQAASLTVYRGDTEVERFFPVSLGRAGAKPSRRRGDNVTPLGEFRVNRFNHESRWHIFIGVDYPTPLHAQVALASGVYSEEDYIAYQAYYRRHGAPPQNTVLGGGIGIHGIGAGSAEVHSQFHWTEGCVAVTNEQIERLTELVGLGTRIVIR
jgi:murein L,D-transpeptidase YafK